MPARKVAVHWKPIESMTMPPSVGPMKALNREVFNKDWVVIQTSTVVHVPQGECRLKCTGYAAESAAAIIVAILSKAISHHRSWILSISSVFHTS